MIVHPRIRSRCHAFGQGALFSKVLVRTDRIPDDLEPTKDFDLIPADLNLDRRG
jgi:hypothetical protein